MTTEITDTTDTTGKIIQQSLQEKKLDISAKNVAGKCDFKCSYTFKYSESASVAKNNEIMISLTYDSTNEPPVVFNQQKYNVESIKITSPSIHMFNGNSLPGELIITHNPVNGGNSLDVCIPLKSSIESSKASQIITDIITKVVATAPSSGDSTNLNMTFNLQNIVPRKPFFYYTQGTTDTIVFGELEAIPLKSGMISILQKIIKPYPVDMPPTQLFYNAIGPTSGLQIGNGIYISCKPTGSSKEETGVEYDKMSSSNTISFTDILKNPIVETLIYILVGCLLLVIVFYAIRVFYDYSTTGTLKLPFMSNTT
jgi:hypothetical protein